MQKADDHGGNKGSTGMTLIMVLPPISHRLVEKVSRDEFVDMQKPLPESWQTAGQKR